MDLIDTYEPTACPKRAAMIILSAAGRPMTLHSLVERIGMLHPVRAARAALTELYETNALKLVKVEETSAIWFSDRPTQEELAKMVELAMVGYRPITKQLFKADGRADRREKITGMLERRIASSHDIIIATGIAATPVYNDIRALVAAKEIQPLAQCIRGPYRADVAYMASDSFRRLWAAATEEK